MVASRSRLAVLVAGLSLVAGGLLLGGAGPSQAIPGAKVFPGTGFGPIPDGGPPQQAELTAANAALAGCQP